jgi:hypothetical protein
MWPGAIELTVWQSPAMLGALDDDPAIEDPLCDGRQGEVAGSELIAGREWHCLAWGRVEGHEEEKRGTKEKRESVWRGNCFNQRHDHVCSTRCIRGSLLFRETGA